MNRNKQLKMNTAFGLISQFVTLVCGFIVPRLILKFYGSDVNGLTASIAHFLSFISLAECGMGAVVQSSLYKPLADSDNAQISNVVASSGRFFRKIGILLSVYVAFLMLTYPFLVETSFDWWYTATLVLAISISTFVQHFICMSYRLLLTADQKGYIQLTINIFTQVINTLLCVILANIGSSIQVLKLCTSMVLLLQPLFLYIYVKKHYKLEKKKNIIGEPIKQKWNGIAQHIAYVVLENTPTVVLTFFSAISSVSVYTVYHLVVSGIKGVVMSAISGMQSLLGNMYAKNEKETLDRTFSYYEWVMHIAVVFLFTCTSILIVPFVRVYTQGVNDANYIFPLFGVMISIGHMMFCLRLPYNAMVFAAGHYKQTQNSAWIEAAVNIIVSVALVFKFGLVGVAIGTLAAVTYRTLYLVVYLRKNIMDRPIKIFLKHFAIDGVVVALSWLVAASFEMNNITTYVSWVVLAIKVAFVVAIIVLVLNSIFYVDLLKGVVNKMFKKMSTDNEN